MSEPELSSSGRKILIVLVLVGLIIRLAVAYVQPAFLDEGYVYYVTKSGIAQAIQSLRIDSHPPTFNILMYPLVSLTSDIFLLRLPTLLLSLGTIVMSFWLARRFLSESISLGIAAFVTLSYNIWITDAQLRTYAPLTFCLTAVWMGMIDIYRHGSPFASWHWAERWRWTLWFLAALSGASLHPQGAMMLGSCALMALALPAQRWRTFILLALGALPVTLWSVINHFTVSGPTPPATASALQKFEALFISPLAIANWDVREWSAFCKSPEQAQFALALLSIVSLVLALLLWGFLARGWYAMSKDVRWEAHFLGFNTVFAPLFVYTIAMLGIFGYTQARYAVPLTVPFLILVCYGISTSSQKQLLALLNAPALLVSLAFPFCPTMWNQYWQSTLDFIDSIKQPRDLIAVNAYSEAGFSFAMAYDIDNIEFKFYDDFNSQLVQRPTPQKLPVALLTPAMMDPSLLHDLQGYRIIMVMSQLNTTPGNREMLQWMDTYYKPVATFHHSSMRNWAIVDVIVWERKQ